MRCIRERSGAATMGLVGVLVAGGMGGESTSVSGLNKPRGTNSPRPLVEVKPSTGELTVRRSFAGLLNAPSFGGSPRRLGVWRLQGILRRERTSRQQFAGRPADRGTIQYRRRRDLPPPAGDRLRGGLSGRPP